MLYVDIPSLTDLKSLAEGPGHETLPETLARSDSWC
jgi:hypothetical protein